MSKAYFAMGLHFHQPVGNFPHVLEKVYKNCYKPFLELVEKYPDIKFSIHFSGCLLDFFKNDHPNIIKLVSKLADRGQIDIMGGGYYEPIFISIPPQDRFGQLELMTHRIKEIFGVEAQGLWTPERVWSPELAALFKKTGLDYSILDDIHFIKAGVGNKDLYGYYLTKYKDSEFKIFPSLKELRYDIPFKPPNQTIDYIIKESKGKNSPLFTYGDDGEKFGAWPGTQKLVYEEGWLEKFFLELLKKNKDIKTIKFSEFLEENPALGKIQILEA